MDTGLEPIVVAVDTINEIKHGEESEAIDLPAAVIESSDDEDRAE